MSQNSKQNAAGVYTSADDVDVSQATISSELSKVWSDEESGAIAVSIDRLLFDSPLEIASRYLEPNGFSLNLENLLAVVDSMRVGIFASMSSRAQNAEKKKAKELMPSLYMQLPRKKDVGPILKKFYEEIGRYEAELSRLQDAEVRAQKAIDLSVKDEPSKKIIESLRTENASLRSDLERIQKKLSSVESILRSTELNFGVDALPANVKRCTVRSVRVQEGVALLKVGETQFSFPLKAIGGTPIIGANGVVFYNSGSPTSVWIYDPIPDPLVSRIARVLSTDGRRVKIKFPSRREMVLTLASYSEVPKKGAQVLGSFSGEYLISLVSVGDETGSQIADLIFDEQTKNQLLDVVSEEVS